ncbi:DNA binding HTH domain, Psq-type,Homeobox domain-like [Cinara cedri]|uniref:DNA binding HTH domain, Psq-type,Homeobox domain-like n=1 Tax=Cinara cedri TaxID=506608 RepID=A0A5E4MEB9_9HEMI|nr:DNA binding HTH domain, Psq-type,Homeobox domain-like [Cinara cedri]
MTNKFEEQLRFTLEYVTSKSLSLNKAAIKYNIPKSTVPMSITVKTPLVRKMGLGSLLSDDEEKQKPKY